MTEKRRAHSGSKPGAPLSPEKAAEELCPRHLGQNRLKLSPKGSVNVGVEVSMPDKVLDGLGGLPTLSRIALFDRTKLHRTNPFFCPLERCGETRVRLEFIASESVIPLKI